MHMNRREFLKASASLTAMASLYGCAGATKASGHVVVVGGGFGGATVAKYLRMWSQGNVQVTLVERNSEFVSCPMSNLVIGGLKSLPDITLGYDNLKGKWGIRVIRDEVTGLDTQHRKLKLAQGGELSYDRLVLSPGIDFMWLQIPGLNTEQARLQVPHAWKAGPQTIVLRQQLEAMRDGGVFAISIPRAPFRCPPGPYERACLVADYFKKHKPKSKVVVLDANPEIQSKKALFQQAWKELYPNMIDYQPNSELRDVDVASKTAILEFDQLKADVLNVIPPQQAGHIATDSGLALINKRWLDVDWLSMESSNTPGVHVLGDAVFPAPTMPKSGHMANQQGKLAAAAILNLLAGDTPNPAPVLMNTCYSFVDDHRAIHVASVHQYDNATRTLQPVKGAGGLSSTPNDHEGKIATAWAQNIWADTLA